jgi:hypothetical protein
MLPEAAILGPYYYARQRRGDILKRRPRQAPAVPIYAHFVKRLAVAVEQLRVRRLPSRAHLIEAGHGRLRYRAPRDRHNCGDSGCA